mgnify:CR=1 FL=1
MIDEQKVQPDFTSADRYVLMVEGDNETYNVGVDIDTGKTFCPCNFKGENCSHKIAAHLFLAGIGVERESY